MTKQQFIKDVKTYAGFTVRGEDPLDTWYDFSLDKELQNLYKVEEDAEAALILACRRKLKEAGIK